MQEFQVKVTADLGDSKQKIASLQRDIDVLTGQQSVKISIDPKGLNLDILKDVSNTLTTIGKINPFTFEFKQGAQIATTFSTIKQHSQTTKDVLVQTYKITREMDGPIRKWDRGIQRIGRSAASVAKVTSTIWNNKDVDGMLGVAFKSAAAGAGILVGEVAKIGFALYGLNEVIGVLRAAWGSFFRETIGREVELRDTILRTRASLASANKVIVNGQEITDPYEKILKLAGPVEQAINSITERSIELAGVTSGEVINMFNMVAANIGRIGGTLKDAEDLAFAFAAGMGTLGMPGYMAPQEINSILGGYIDRNSRLAQALQISNEDIQKARGEEGGVVEFLKKRLEAVVAGQKIAAQGFTGVVSNIKDLYELTTGNFGAGLLDPLIAGLTVVFEKLNGIRDQIFKIAKGFGTAISSTAAVAFGMFNRGRSIELDPSVNVFDNRGLALESIQKQAGGEKYRKETLDYFDTIGASIRSSIQNAFVELGKAFAKFQPTLLILTDALRSLVQSFASIKVGTFNALVSALAAAAEVISRLTPSIAMLVNMWARLLNTPVVRYFYEVTTTLKVLKAAGGDILLQGYLIIRFITSALGPAIAKLAQGGLTLIGVIQAINTSLASFAGSIGGAISGLGSALGALLPASNKGPQQIKDAGQNIAALGANLKEANKTLDVAKGKLSGLGSSLQMLGIGSALFMGKLLLVQLAISAVVDAIGKYQKAQEDKKSFREAEQALGSLQRNYEGVTRSLTAAEQADKSFKESLVNTEYDKAIARVRELKAEINDLTYEMNKPGIQTWGEFWRSFLVNPDRPGSETVDAITKREIERRKAEAAGQQPFIDAVNRERDLKQAREDVRVAGENRKNIEKEIADLRRQLDNDLFQQRQALAQKEVEIFRAAGELRIQQIERANAKLLEGEEGASRAALEALDNYISTKERGELEIAAAQKTLAIEVSNLEKAISDYRYDIEKKIAELRKKSADYEKNAADARARAAGDTPAGASALSQLIGSVESFGGDYGAYNRGGSNQGRTAHGSGIDPNLVNMTIAEIQRRQLAPGVPAGQQLHAVGKYQIIGSTLRGLMSGSYGETGVRPSDKFTPENQEKLFAALARSRVIPGNESATMRGLRQEWVGLQNVSDARLRAAIAPLMGGAAAGGATAPDTSPASELPNAADAASRYAEAVRSLTGAMERLRSLQAAITEAKTVEAFERIAKAAFPEVALEQYQDQLAQLQFTYTALSSSAEAAFDPERTALEATRLAQVAIAARELQQFTDGIAQRQNLTDEQRKRAIDSVRQRHGEYLKQLEREAEYKRRILTTERVNAFMQENAIQVRNIEQEIEALRTRNRMQAEGFAPEVIEAEIAKLDIRRKLNQLTEQLTSQLQTEIDLRDKLQSRITGASDSEKDKLKKELAEREAEIAELRERLKGVPAAGKALFQAQDALAMEKTKRGQRIKAFIGEAQRQLTDFEGMAIQVSQSVGNAVGNSLSNAVTGLIEGTTTIKDIFANFLKEIGNILIQQATSMIATYVAIGIAKMFAFGDKGGFSFTGAGPAKLPSGDGFAAGFSMPKLYADGGYVTGPTRAVVGEGGEPEYVIPSSKMREAMSRYSAGARGSSVIPDASGGKGGLSMTSGAHFTLETVVINNVEYATVDQVRAMGQRAAAQGAEGGHTRSMRTLQQSRAQRARLGMS